MASKEAWLGKGLLACCWVGGNKPCNEQQQPASRRLSFLDGLLCIGIVNGEPPYAEPHVRWCERSENESRKKTTSFSSYSMFLLIPRKPLIVIISVQNTTFNIFEDLR